MTNHPTPTTPSSAAVIGCGRRQEGKTGFAQGHAHARGYLAAFPGITLYGVDPNPENLAAFGEAFELPPEQLFPSTAELYQSVRPEMVSIATWPGLHHSQVIEAAGAGIKQIVCEKPLATDNSEIEAMIRACQKSGARLAVAHQRRYLPAFENMREMLEAEILGEGVVLTARVPDQWDMLSWMTHWFDMANYLFGGPPESVLAGIDHTGQRRYGHAVENTAVIYASYSDDREGVFLSGLGKRPPGVQLVGTNGTLRTGGEELVHLSAAGQQIVPISPDPLPPGMAYGRLVQDLARAAADGGDFRADVSHTAWATRMAFAAQESALKQRAIQLPSSVRYAPLEVAQHPPQVAPPPSRRILLLGDAHHFDTEIRRTGRDGLVEALADLGHHVHSVPLEERHEREADFQEAEVLVIYHTRREPGPSTKQLVGGWIRSGRPTLVVHCGIGAWIWKEFREWIGRYWIWRDEDGAPPSRHPIAACEVEVIRPDLWSAPWRKAWLPRDEIYTGLGEAGPVEDIAWALLEGERQPFAWRSKSHPHVAAYLPGHRFDIWQLPAVGSGLASMLELTAKARL